jgi:hypothetical protein
MLHNVERCCDNRQAIWSLENYGKNGWSNYKVVGREVKVDDARNVPGIRCPAIRRVMVPMLYDDNS